MELEDFHDNTRQSLGARARLLQDLTEINLTAIALPCTQASALSCLDDVEMYFKNARIRRTV